MPLPDWAEYVVRNSTKKGVLFYHPDDEKNAKAFLLASGKRAQIELVAEGCEPGEAYLIDKRGNIAQLRVQT